MPTLKLTPEETIAASLCMSLISTILDGQWDHTADDNQVVIELNEEQTKVVNRLRMLFSTALMAFRDPLKVVEESSADERKKCYAGTVALGRAVGLELTRASEQLFDRLAKTYGRMDTDSIMDKDTP